MTAQIPTKFEDYIASRLDAGASAPAMTLARAIEAKYPGAAVFLYGSGISVSAHESPSDILFDFYVIAPDYSAIEKPVERFFARALPPNVYYFEMGAGAAMLRCKYALLSLDHFERLVGPETFHSYFWARFAQPCRLVLASEAMRPRLVAAVRCALETFLSRARGVAHDPRDWRDVWLSGLGASYKAELRAEAPDRAGKLLDSYGDWPRVTASFALSRAGDRPQETGGAFAWRMRALFGGFLSIARLLKATTTFKGGIDYIAWKVKRHSGIDVEVKPWERRHPFFAAPIVAARYYRLRRETRAQMRAN